MMKSGLIFGIDFDGTCVTHEFPKVGKDLPYAVEILKKIVQHGGKLILWTMRSNHDSKPVYNSILEDQPNTHNPVIECEAGDYLNHAVNWFAKNDIELWGIQSNPQQSSWTSSPKAYCHIYIDDAALGCPIMMVEGFSNRPFVDWITVDALLFPEEF